LRGPEKQKNPKPIRFETEPKSNDSINTFQSGGSVLCTELGGAE